MGGSVMGGTTVHFKLISFFSGCDYTSYFSGYGKATVLNTFFQCAEFITGTQMPESLSETTTLGSTCGDTRSTFQLSFLFMAMTFQINC